MKKPAAEAQAGESNVAFEFPAQRRAPFESIEYRIVARAVRGNDRDTGRSHRIRQVEELPLEPELLGDPLREPLHP
jgi:hypothetical protein